MKFTRLLIPVIFVLCTVPAHALVLRGVVTEIRDGQTIVIYSNGQKLNVILKAVDAPEMDQEFGEVSRQHLSSLILNRPVQVEFSELQTRNVIAKVTCNHIDIGLQVIRDGAAWYDRASERTLNDVDRNVYPLAEQAARSEMRGLWQDGSPMPPWEWRRAQAAKLLPQANYKSNGGATLQSEDILFTGRKPVGGAKGSANRIPLAKPTGKPFNTPGQDADFVSYLDQGRVSVVYFYADWCPACRKLSPVMDQINAVVPDMQVLFMNIEDWGTPVARQYGISFVPYLKVYDKSGKLVAEGKNARAWLEQQGLGAGGR